MHPANYIVGDSRNITQIFEEQQLIAPKLIITSPPYFDRLDYNSHTKQIGFGQQSYDDYLNDVVNVLHKSFELADDNCTLWLIVDTFRKNGELQLLPFDITNKLKQGNPKTWILKEVIIWDKEKNLPWNGKGYFKNEFEYILFFVKSDSFTFNIDEVREINDLKKWWKTYPERYNPDGKAPSNIWAFTTPIRGWGNGRQNHLCPLPFQLVEKIISIASNEGDMVFDPFAGSGTVLGISHFMKRRSAGIDINIDYKELFEKEVIIGAEKYWINKQLELSKSNFTVSDFRSINDKLRKLKLASVLCSHINKTNSHKFLYLTKGNDQEGGSIEIYVMENGVTPVIDLNDTALQSLVKQAKINPKVILIKDIDFYDKFRDLKLFKYQFKKFYSYTSPCRLETIGKKEERYDYIYSNIEVKISDY